MTNMSETFFTADLHLGHRFMAKLRGIVTPDGEPDVPAHDEMLINFWKAFVGPRDTVYVLGDVSYLPPDEMRTRFHQLTGRKKHLIIGNHDRAHTIDLPWSSTQDRLRQKIDGHTLVMDHYPLLTWQNAQHGSWMLHGHTHGNLDPTLASTRMDVGVDCAFAQYGAYRPFYWEEIREFMADREYDKVDHHGQASLYEERNAEKRAAGEL
jgi:calcineurin-like phosphoesterase family protein